MQIANAISFADSFIDSCELAAIKDDGTVSKQEAKNLKKIKSGAEKFKKELERLK